ncbi:hypothetical protein ACFXB3_02425 [Streptomyces sp. NPDC059447]|uniref:hypothetical protein n=1 Tax=Streptomyces sp. NPDC059447 TaxID=3346834 RepID=UPI0036AE4F5A
MKLPWRGSGGGAVLGNRAVAKANRKVFDRIERSGRRNPTHVAKEYAREIGSGQSLVRANGADGARYHLGFNVAPGDFADVTKRSMLVSDVLMLTQDAEGPVIPLGEYSSFNYHESQTLEISTLQSTPFGVRCTNLAELGQWILDAEDLLKSGVAWYLPRISRGETSLLGNVGHERFNESIQTDSIDYDFLIRDGRAIEASGVEPIASHVVRRLFTMQVPYIEGVSLKDFSRLTSEEFTSYTTFKTGLRQRLLDIDESIEDVQSQRKISAIEDEIRHGVSLVETQMANSVKRTKLADGGAAVCMTTVMLCAVYKPTLLSLVAALGLNAGGLWNAAKTRAEERKMKASEGEWFYMWALMKDSEVR